ncbi:MAG: hypothetical protein AAFQ94_00750 [Bacteroidota bacterium]
MWKNIVFVVLGILLFCVDVNAQTVVIEENDVPLNVQAWFYKRYDKPKNLQWSTKQISGKKCFAVSFNHKGRLVSSLYDPNGAILEESAVNNNPILSSEIKEYVKANYDKFKALRLKSIKIFNTISPQPIVYYQLVGKTNQDNVSVWFDSNNQIRKKKDFSGYALAN